MKQLWTALAVLLVGPQTFPQANSGTLTGRVMRSGGTEGIAGVQIILSGPSPVLQGGYTPSPSLTDTMRAQIDQLIASAPPGIAPDVVANAAVRMEAQLLGLTPPPTLAGGAAAPQIFVTTDQEGNFIFQNLAPGRYQVRAQKDGYFAAPPPGAVGVPTIVNATATVETGQITPPVEMRMLRGATISGRVRDPNGQPVSNMQVMAQQWSYRDGRPTLTQMNSKTTDDRGEFRLFWLPPGDYLISANPPRPAINPRPTDAYARTWFPNAPEPRFAPRITVAEGAEMGGLDISINPQSPVSVSGQIASGLTGPNGQPSVPQPTLFLLPRDPNAILDTLAPNFSNVSPNRNSGQFEIRGVPPGSYDLVALAPDTNGRPFPGRTPIEVGFSNLESVSINIHRGVEVRARVVFDGTPVAAAALPAPPPPPPPPNAPPGFVPATPLPPPPAANVPGIAGVGIRVQLRSREAYTPPFDSAASASATTDASGAFVFANVPQAHYTVMVSGLPAGAYVEDIREGGVSIYDTGLRVTTEPPGPIEVLVSSKSGQLEGNVANSIQQPAEGATVVLVPALARRGNAALFRTARSTAQGIFRIPGIPPGEYKLFAWQTIPPTAYMNAEYMARYENRGIPITIAPGTNQQANLTAIADDSQR